MTRIESDPKVMMGKPVVGGTRISVESILERLGAGETLEQVLLAHPRLKAEDIRAALSEHGGELVGAFTVIRPGTIRLRRPLS